MKEQRHAGPLRGGGAKGTMGRERDGRRRCGKREGESGGRGRWDEQRHQAEGGFGAGRGVGLRDRETAE